jgi:hypothetical protein
MIVEVDAKYIKGMLLNPDIAPSASINRWILSILMFHFTLVHVPGTHHRPDGLSRRRPQPGNEEEPEDDFEDWIDQVNGFIDFINDLPSHKQAFSTSPPMTCFITTTERLEDEDSDDRGAKELTTDEPNRDTPTSYDIVPRSSTAIAADDKMAVLYTAPHTPVDSSSCDIFVTFVTWFHIS